MAGDRLLETVARIREIAGPYATHVTKLSNFIESLERFLDSLDAKIDIEVFEPESQERVPLRLAFERGPIGWRFFIGTDPEHDIAQLTQASLEYKIRAAPLLAELLAKLLKAYEDRLATIQKNTTNLTTLMEKFTPAPRKEANEDE